MYLKMKRIFDFSLALVLIIITSIPMAIISIAIKLEDKGPVIYKSKRMGKGLKTFYVYKFRSMTTKREELNSNLSHEQMVTKVGKVIRKTSLDELPQLFNILKGEMSFIGPRPWIMEYYDWFTDEQKKRVEVLPGISGLAQVHGRNGIGIFKKIEYDLEYVNNISLKTDVQILWETVKVVLSKEEAEMSEDGIKEEIKQLKESNTILLNTYKEVV